MQPAGYFFIIQLSNSRRVLQPKLKNFVVIFSSYPLTKVITYQGIAFWKNTHYNPIFDS